MDQAVLERARALRRQHPTVRTSIILAWARTPEPELLIPDHDGVVRLERDGFEVTITVENEDDPMLMGRFTSTWEPGAVENPGARNDNGVHTYYVPGTTYDEHAADLSKYGYSRGTCDELARSYVAQDLKNDLEPQYVILVTASRNGTELGFDSLGCIGIDETSDHTRQFSETIATHGMVANAIDAARKQLAALGQDELTVLVIEDKHDTTITLHRSHEGAKKALHGYAVQGWELHFEEPEPDDPQEAIDRFFDGRMDVSYRLESVTIED